MLPTGGRVVVALEGRGGSRPLRAHRGDGDRSLEGPQCRTMRTFAICEMDQVSGQPLVWLSWCTAAGNRLSR
jgi:hypothetical protein